MPVSVRLGQRIVAGIEGCRRDALNRCSDGLGFLRDVAVGIVVIGGLDATPIGDLAHVPRASYSYITESPFGSISSTSRNRSSYL